MHRLDVTALTPMTVLAMFGHRYHWMSATTQTWVELALSVPIVLWAGAPFFVRGWRFAWSESASVLRQRITGNDTENAEPTRITQNPNE